MPDQKIEAPETRDADELKEQAVRFSAGIPIGANGKPMVKITAGASDKVPTVQYGNVVLGPIAIERFIEDDGDQAIIDASRSLQRNVEYILGTERRLLTYALNPELRVRDPHTGQDAFAQRPDGYDPTAIGNPAAEADKAAEASVKE